MSCGRKGFVAIKTEKTEEHMGKWRKETESSLIHPSLPDLAKDYGTGWEELSAETHPGKRRN